MLDISGRGPAQQQRAKKAEWHFRRAERKAIKARSKAHGYCDGFYECPCRHCDRAMERDEAADEAFLARERESRRIARAGWRRLINVHDGLHSYPVYLGTWALGVRLAADQGHGWPIRMDSKNAKPPIGVAAVSVSFTL